MLLIWSVVVFAAILRAFTGFGFALAAVPVFSLFMAPAQAVVLSASLTLAVSLATLRSYWGGYPLLPMAPMIGMSLPGTALGAWILREISPQQFRLWIGLAVIAACLLLTWYRPRRHRPRPVLTGGVGLGSGLLNGAFAIPGPPVIIYAMAVEADPRRSRALLMTFFLFAAIIALCSYAAAGFVTARSPWLFLLALPAMLLGDRLGFYLFHRHGNALYRRVALLALLAIGVTITAQALFGSG
ncbi:MAG: sulfite exporter TauE/SafE family protein [Halioglobus sp.]|nr:sulfite exporter TauE/SafE family protein [Halioglobus sp.]